MGPERRKRLGISSNSRLYDPMVNAKAMAMISNKGTNWRPWSTYTNGAYKEFMDTAGGAAPAGWDPFEDFWDDLLGPPERGPGSQGWESDPLDVLPDWQLDMGIGDVASGIKSIAELMIGAGDWMKEPRNWVRVAQVLAGGLLIAVGINAMTSGILAPAVMKAATSAGPGKAAKAATKAAAS
jgi:hypothetical protein